MATSLKGKVVVVTGASSGFGEDAALLFASEGCSVVLAARRIDRLHALADKIHAQGGEALVVPVDVTQRTEIELMVQSVIDIYGQIDILYNNAGFGRLDWLERLDPQRDIQTQIEVNLLGLIQTTRAVLPHMLTRRSGHIINMSSVAGLIAAPLHTIYAASKFGVRAFSDALRREVSPFGIHVSVIYPAWAKTEFSQHTSRNRNRPSLNRFKSLALSSKYVAQRVVRLAKHPRRKLIIPWWFRLIIAIDYLAPGLVDWFLKQTFTRRLHQLEE